MVKRPTSIQPRKYGAKKKAEQLSPQQRMFVEELVADPTMSPTQAALKAGYSQKTASVKASQMLKNPVIAQMVGNALQKRIERVQVNQDDVLKFLYQALTLDPLDLFDEVDGALSLKQLQDIPEDIRRLITKIDAKSRPIGDEGQVETRVKLEWVSKELVLQLCMKHLGMLNNGSNDGDVNVNVQVITNNNLVQQLREAVHTNSKVIDAQAITRLASS